MQFIFGILALSIGLAVLTPMSFGMSLAVVLLALIAAGALWAAHLINEALIRRRGRIATERGTQIYLQRAHDEIRAEAPLLIRKHGDALARRRISLVHVDHYGIRDDGAWWKEVDYFITSVIAPRLPEVARSLRSEIRQLVDEIAAERARQIVQDVDLPSDVTPLEFEARCSSILVRQGWNARTTKASGDQGADVVAEMNGIRAVLQRKLYTSPVGNKAVQEAYAAKRHYGAQLACVVGCRFYAGGKRTSQFDRRSAPWFF